MGFEKGDKADELKGAAVGPFDGTVDGSKTGYDKNCKGGSSSFFFLR